MSIKAKITETDIRRQLVGYLRMRGWFVYHCLAGLGSYPGLSDLVAVKDGRIVHIEVKKPGTGRQSKNQEKFQADIEAAGGEYCIAKSIEDLQEMESQACTTAKMDQYGVLQKIESELHGDDPAMQTLLKIAAVVEEEKKELRAK